MPSLTKLFSIAAVAFAAFTSAAPTHSNGDIVARAPCACAEPGVPSLPAIVADLQVDVKIYIDQLTAIRKETCTVEVIKPIVVGLCAKIDEATAKVWVLSKYKITEILFTGEAVLDIREFGNLLCGLVISIFTAVGVCLRIGVSVDVHDLLCLVGIAVARLLHCIFGVVGGLLAQLLVVLCARLSGVFWVFVQLKIVDLYALLKINVSLFL